jgi:hypothetical protein
MALGAGMLSGERLRLRDYLYLVSAGYRDDAKASR